VRAGVRGFHRDDRVDFDRRAERQHRHADGAARVATRFAEQRFHQLGSAVRDLRLLREGRIAVHEHAQLDDLFDPRPVAVQRLADLCDEHQRAAPRGVIAACLVGVGAQPSGHDLPVAEGKLAADMQQPARLDDGDIGGNRRGGFGKLEAEVGELGSNIHGDSFCLDWGDYTASGAGAGAFSASRANIQSCAAAQSSMRAWAWRAAGTLSAIAGSPTMCRRHTSGASIATE
jgi:hypothetical protein